MKLILVSSLIVIQTISAAYSATLSKCDVPSEVAHIIRNAAFDFGSCDYRFVEVKSLSRTERKFAYFYKNVETDDAVMGVISLKRDDCQIVSAESDAPFLNNVNKPFSRSISNSGNLGVCDQNH